jgi:chorismate dehydratase
MGLSKPKIAASTYLNSLPLCWSFLYGSHRHRCEFIADVAPARCAEMLRQKEVDAALIPSIEYQRLDDILIVPGLTVAVNGAVRSVILVHEKPIEEVNSVSLDLSSRTGAALTTIFFRYFQHREVHFRTHPPDLPEMLKTTDAALLIGDPALLANHHNTTFRITDWGYLWKQLTGLPFVFALWGIRREAVDRMAAIDFSVVKQEAAASLPRIIDESANRLQLPYSYVEEYLNRCLIYDLSDECLNGLNRFYDLASQVGLIESVNPMEFYRL